MVHLTKVDIERWLEKNQMKELKRSTFKSVYENHQVKVTIELR